MTPTILKLILLAVILLEHLLGLIPLKIGLKQTSVLSCLNCFSAGIFLAMAMIHLFPEALELYAGYAKSVKLEKPFPVPCLCFLGCLVLLVSSCPILRAWQLHHAPCALHLVWHLHVFQLPLFSLCPILTKASINTI